MDMLDLALIHFLVGLILGWLMFGHMIVFFWGVGGNQKQLWRKNWVRQGSGWVNLSFGSKLSNLISVLGSDMSSGHWVRIVGLAHQLAESSY